MAYLGDDQHRADGGQPLLHEGIQTPLRQGKGDIVRARKDIESYGSVPCTSCNYCTKVCPEGIGISGALTSINYITLYGDEAFAKNQVKWNIDGAGKKRPSNCIKCGKCEKACPQHLEIVSLLEKTVPYFG